MKKPIHFLHVTLFALLAISCEQELVDNSASPCPSDDPSIICPQVQTTCPDGASAGSASFSKFVAVGTSFTVGFQAGALFNDGQNASLGNILATQFACVGGGTFNQPSIRSVNGYNVFFDPNPVGTTVLGRFKLQGTPPLPAPVSSGDVPNSDALPNPQLNPGFMYTGSAGAVASADLNNFSVPVTLLGQALRPETGDWGDTDGPLFNPFYARFASNPGTSTLIQDAASSMAKDGTFLLFWLGMDDALLHAAYGGDPTRAPLTSLADFQTRFGGALAALMGVNPNAKGVVASYPDPFLTPHFTAVPWNPIPLDANMATMLTDALADNYNAFLDGMVAATVITTEEANLRKIFFAPGQNAILMNDETLTDLTPYMAGVYAALQPYALARQSKPTDIVPLAAQLILGTELGPNQIMGVTVPVEDRHILIPEESEEIRTRIDEFNAYIESVASGTYSGRLAFADVNAGLKNLVTAQAGVSNGVVITPNINPPTGIYSEDGLHPNSRGYAFIANIIIDAINNTFGATVPKANIGTYPATGLPINP